MEKSPSWKANSFLVSQQIPRILWQPKVHYGASRFWTKTHTQNMYCLLLFHCNSCWTNAHQFYVTIHCLSGYILEVLVHKLSTRLWRVKDESSRSYSRSATKRWAPLLTWKSDSDTCRKLVGRLTDCSEQSRRLVPHVAWLTDVAPYSLGFDLLPCNST